ncbi:MAG: UDP-N-acetylglucosamine 2-epimerase (hydrolyzing), partial [Selenomonadaceae bacterium]|nr:UDP-N-acetylglucosamine 2-epimerase (hydrolyzing) [Selenomonadaceae bacterium]
IGFADYFAARPLNALMVLGDRFETLAVCCAAMNARIPIVHLYGGETTIGAIDEAIRHSITKMSVLHFTSTEAYRRRVIQLGEAPDRVFNVGAMGVENALNTELLDRHELSASLGFDLDGDYSVVTFHPITLEGDPTVQLEELLCALDRFGDMKFIITKANADAGGRLINARLAAYASEHANSILVDSLGALRYLSALKHALMVIGNSSSGIMEAPAFRIPTVNIGDRQTGRIKPTSVIDCRPTASEIVSAIERARRLRVSGAFDDMINPYGDGRTSDKIVEIVCDRVMSGRLDLKKSFYDLPTAN